MSSIEHTNQIAVSQPTVLQTLVKLFKLRIVSLLLFSSTGGAFLGAMGKPAFIDLVILLITGGLAAAGASALNQYLEKDSDADMKRTSERPLVVGNIAHPEWVLWIALAMIILPVVAVWPSNPALGFFLLVGAIIYVAVYTVWLKPRTILNIVIGGAAGSCAVLSGGAAVSAWSDPGVIALAAIVFLWTPTHFWALALLYKEDYAAADIPMLPVITSPRQSAIWGLIHAVGVAIITIALAAHTALGIIYFIAGLLATIYFVYQSIKLVIEPSRQQALRLFLASNSYLALVLLAICLSTAIGW